VFVVVLIQQPHHENVWGNGVIGQFTADQCESRVSSTGCFILYETTTSGFQNPFLITRLLIFEHDIPAE